MRSGVIRGALVGALVLLTAAAVMAQAPKTVTLTGTVVQVEGNTLVVKMASGDMRVFTPPADRRFMIDGRSLTLSQLRPGMTLTATATETATTVMDRTVQTLSGRDWYASGPTVILTLASGENRMYTVKSDDPVKFYDGEGKEMTVFDLRKGMNIKATKITEAPRTEFVTTAVVTGTAAGAAAAGAAGSAGAATGAAAATKAPSATASPAGSAAPAAASAPAKLPKTGSPMPLVGMLGGVSLAIGAGLTLLRRRNRR
jgi:LPXTG-motif cell wall-anchored protein